MTTQSFDPLLLYLLSGAPAHGNNYNDLRAGIDPFPDTSNSIEQELRDIVSKRKSVQLICISFNDSTLKMFSKMKKVLPQLHVQKAD